MLNLKLIENIRCQFCNDTALTMQEGKLICNSCKNNYEVVEKIPVFLKKDLTAIEQETESIYDRKLVGCPNLIEEGFNSLNDIFNVYPQEKLITTHLDLTHPFLGRNKRILEVGCGRGELASKLCKSAGDVEYYGFDLSLRSLIAAYKNVDYCNLFLFKANALDIPFPDNFFDIVICSEVLEHIPESDKVVREILRVLRKDGVASISVPNSCMILYPLELFSLLRHKGFAKSFTMVRRLLRREESWSPKEDDAYDRAFLPGQFKNLFRANGFKILTYKTILFFFMRRPYVDILNLLEKIKDKSIFLKLVRVYAIFDRLIIESRIPILNKMGIRQFLLVQK